MQLARMRWHLNTRTLRKTEQILRAVQLELSYSKHDILEAYLNYAPMAGILRARGSLTGLFQ